MANIGLVTALLSSKEGRTTFSRVSILLAALIGTLPTLPKPLHSAHASAPNRKTRSAVAHRPPSGLLDAIAPAPLGAV